MSEINFPDSLKSENDAFYGCKEEVVNSIPLRLKTDENGVMHKLYSEDVRDRIYRIPDGVKKIDKRDEEEDYRKPKYNDSVFKEITEIMFPNSVVSIGKNVIRDLSNLKKVIMPDSVTELEGNFYGCENLETVRLSRKLKGINQSTILYLTSAKLSCVIIPDSAEVYDYDPKSGYTKNNYGHYGYYKQHLNEDRIWYCKDRHDFGKCASEGLDSSLQVSVTQDKTRKKYSTMGSEEIEKEESHSNSKRRINMSDLNFLDETTKYRVSAKNGVKEIGPFAFSQCPMLEVVDIEEGITKIGPGAFAECFNLKKVVLPKTIEEISDFAFFGCKSLETIELDGKSVSIGDFAFAKCEAMEHVSLPEKVPNVGIEAFLDCTNLKYTTGMNNVGKIGDWAFSGCEQLKISIPKKVEEIGMGAYLGAGFKKWQIRDANGEIIEEYAGNEGTIILPNELEKIGRNAFANCKGITDVFFRPGESRLKEIPEETFYGCSNICSFEIPDGIEKIGDKAFSNCEKIEELYFPESISKIGSEGFSGCKNLQTVMFKGDKSADEISASDAFDGCARVRRINFSDLNHRTTNIDGDIFEIAGKERSGFTLKAIKETIKVMKRARDRN